MILKQVSRSIFKEKQKSDIRQQTAPFPACKAAEKWKRGN
jgi:hypothetical protein